ncbi:hypothetical protein [Streptomyces sp. NBC_01508]|uniref:hypothetical protein n=1 Tax=Streptomyces sp. NBC_01508 TaxID=2903888 RepID=UPI0038672532
MEVAPGEHLPHDRPDGDASWLAYGDVLTEQGDVRGELIRMEWRHARSRPADREALRRDVDALVAEHRHRWDAELPDGVTAVTRRYGFATKVAVDWSDDAPALIERALRERFVTALCIAPAAQDDEDYEDWEGELDEDGEPAPPPLVAAGALAGLDLSRLVELDLSYLRIGGPGAEALAASLATGRIRTLDLRYCAMDDAGLAALAASPALGGLRRLHLQRNALTARGMCSLHRFERLVELDLRYNEIGEEGVDALLAAPFIGSVERLLLYRADVSDAGAKKLALDSRIPATLRSYWRSV